MRLELDFETLLSLSAAAGVSDVACPLCGPECETLVNRRRKVLRIWDDDGFITYKCARCDASGYGRDLAVNSTHAPRERTAIEPVLEKDKTDLARYLWSRSLPLVGSLAETYLRSRRCFIESDALRFMPARNNHMPAMIARFGGGEITGVHLTKLRADGLGKAGTENDKIIIGSSMGQPIILCDNKEREELTVSEGIEDGASLGLVTGWSAWAAGTANRIAPVLATAGQFGKVYLATDLDWGKKEHVRAGPKALKRAQEIRPDVIALHFEKALGLKIDANKAKIQFGSDVLLTVIEWCEAKARFKHHKIGCGEFQTACDRANLVFTALAECGATV